MYAHTARDGKPIDGDRLYMGEDGELQRVRTYAIYPPLQTSIDPSTDSHGAGGLDASLRGWLEQTAWLLLMRARAWLAVLQVRPLRLHRTEAKAGRSEEKEMKERRFTTKQTPKGNPAVVWVGAVCKGVGQQMKHGQRAPHLTCCHCYTQ
jgi:hypothetical protein